LLRTPSAAVELLWRAICRSEAQELAAVDDAP